VTAADTMLDAFAPPEHMVGHSAVLVAMPGEAEFLEEVMERFMGLRARQRSQLGLNTAYLLLDPHASDGRTSVFPPGRVPGLHELTPRPVDSATLLHAKLALLAFAPSRQAAPTHVRLVVLTANYTYGSAKQQLELVWRLDVPLGEPSPAEDRADIAAAASFVTELITRRFYRDDGSRPAAQRRITERLDGLMAAIATLRPSSAKPRFIHSLDRPLFDQIRARFKRVLDGRNLLLCGSGFYEKPSEEPRKPEILTRLESLDVFTSNPTRIALVEPGEAGALATWARAGATDGWTVVRATDPLGRNRRLHAKFIYCGYRRDGHLSNGWLYLGSGNLSRRGLLTSAQDAGGNIECGVLVAVPERIRETDELMEWLFWDATAAPVATDEWKVGRVGDGPEDAGLIAAAPILFASVATAPAFGLVLGWRDDVAADAQVSVAWSGTEWRAVTPGEAWIALSADSPGPMALRVRDDATQQVWTVLVVDASGRVAWQPPRYDTFEDALDALLEFPVRPAEASSEEDEEVEDDRDGGGGGVAGSPADADRSRSYALHAAAELIERTAALQRTLSPDLLDDWLDHLDRTLRAGFPEELIATWRSHRIDVLAHLQAEPLRPPEMSEEQRTRYSEVLARASAAWGLS